MELSCARSGASVCRGGAACGTPESRNCRSGAGHAGLTLRVPQDAPSVYPRTGFSERRSTADAPSMAAFRLALEEL